MTTNFKTNLRKYIYLALGFVDKVLNQENNLIIYCYHNIHPNHWVFNVRLDNFEKQIEYLTSWGEPVTLNEIDDFLTGKRELPKRAFAITFDDGYFGINKTVEILEKKGIKPTVFAFPNPNQVLLSEIETRSPLLKPEQMIKLLKRGWEIGSHGISHRKLTLVSDEDAEKEISKSKSELERILQGKKIKYFAYPHGKQNTKIQELVKNSDYRLGFSMNEGIIRRGANLYTIPRVGVMGNHSLEEFKVLGSPSVLKFRKFVKQTPLARFI